MRWNSGGGGSDQFSGPVIASIKFATVYQGENQMSMRRKESIVDSTFV
jgi:hypothetical protein